jgi:hypothetical protein
MAAEEDEEVSTSVMGYNSLIDRLLLSPLSVRDMIDEMIDSLFPHYFGPLLLDNDSGFDAVINIFRIANRCSHGHISVMLISALYLFNHFPAGFVMMELQCGDERTLARLKSLQPYISKLMRQLSSSTFRVDNIDAFITTVIVQIKLKWFSHNTEGMQRYALAEPIQYKQVATPKPKTASKKLYNQPGTYPYHSKNK